MVQLKHKRNWSLTRTECWPTRSRVKASKRLPGGGAKRVEVGRRVEPCQLTLEYRAEHREPSGRSALEDRLRIAARERLEHS